MVPVIWWFMRDDPRDVAGVIRTQFGTYAPAFVGAGALCVIAALAVLPIARRTAVMAPA